jgi:hypothetical protein
MEDVDGSVKRMLKMFDDVFQEIQRFAARLGMYWTSNLLLQWILELMP